MKEIIKTLLYEWKGRKLPETKDRDIELDRYLNKPRKIIMISGFRRTGKTYLVFNFIKDLLKAYDKEEVIYLNFEDERIPPKTEFLTSLMPAIKETFSKKTKILFLDELQAIEGWSKWLRRIYDTEDLFIFVTGSSSKLSTREIPTELRGRYLNIEIFPISFKEFLKFKNIEINEKDIEYNPDKRAVILRALNEYVKFGGLPETTPADDEEKKEILQNYYKTVVNRDVIERFNVKNEEGIKSLLRLLLNSTSYSVNKLYNTMKSLGMKIGKTALLNYISYIETSYFLHSVMLFSKKIKDQLQYPRKNYFIDNGFITSLSLKFSDNKSRLYENLVFIMLKRRISNDFNREIYYWKSQKNEEVDFVIKNSIKTEQLIQVCYDIKDHDTKKRELRALVKASDELKCKNLLVITHDKKGKEVYKDKKIIYIPLLDWLLKD